MNVRNIGALLSSAVKYKHGSVVAKRDCLRQMIDGSFAGLGTDLADVIFSIKTSPSIMPSTLLRFEEGLFAAVDSQNAEKRSLARQVLTALKSYESLIASHSMRNIEQRAQDGAAASPAARRADPAAATLVLDPFAPPGPSALTPDEQSTFDFIEARTGLVDAGDGINMMRSDSDWGDFGLHPEECSDIRHRYAFHSVLGKDRAGSAGHSIMASEITSADARVAIASQYPNKFPNFLQAIVENNLTGVHNLAKAEDIKKDNKFKLDYTKIKVDARADSSAQGFIVLADKTILVSRRGVLMPNGNRVKVQIKSRETVQDSQGVLRTHVYDLTLDDGSSVRTLPVLHTDNWDDFGAVNAGSLTDLIKLRERIFGRQNLPSVCVHCRAGVGRTGTLILAEDMLLRARPLEPALKDIRRSRSAFMVQSTEQSLCVLAFARMHGLALTDSAASTKAAAAMPAAFVGKENVWQAIQTDQAAIDAFVKAHDTHAKAEAILADLEARSRADRGQTADSDTEGEDFSDDDDFSDLPPPPPPPSSGTGHGKWRRDGSRDSDTRKDTRDDTRDTHFKGAAKKPDSDDDKGGAASGLSRRRSSSFYRFHKAPQFSLKQEPIYSEPEGFDKPASSRPVPPLRTKKLVEEPIYDEVYEPASSKEEEKPSPVKGRAPMPLPSSSPPSQQKSARVALMPPKSKAPSAAPSAPPAVPAKPALSRPAPPKPAAPPRPPKPGADGGQQPLSPAELFLKELKEQQLKRQQPKD